MQFFFIFRIFCIFDAENSSNYEKVRRFSHIAIGHDIGLPRAKQTVANHELQCAPLCGHGHGGGL